MAAVPVVVTAVSVTVGVAFAVVAADVSLGTVVAVEGAAAVVASCAAAIKLLCANGARINVERSTSQMKRFVI